MDDRFKKGLQLVDWRGRDKDTRGGGSWRSAKWYKEGLEEVVWKHTEETFREVLGEEAGGKAAV
jgi:hypothetical protein